MIRSILILLILIMLAFSCKKSKEDPTSGDIKIYSLNASVNPVKAWDTTLITIDATGKNLQFGWDANHGSIVGSGQQVKYAAGQCCVGLNTITCRVFNETGEASDTIMIRVTSYFGPK